MVLHENSAQWTALEYIAAKGQDVVLLVLGSVSLQMDLLHSEMLVKESAKMFFHRVWLKIPPQFGVNARIDGAEIEGGGKEGCDTVDFVGIDFRVGVGFFGKPCLGKGCVRQRIR